MVLTTDYPLFWPCVCSGCVWSQIHSLSCYSALIQELSPLQAAFSCLPWQMIWQGSSQWEALEDMWVSGGKEWTRYFSASGGILSGSCVFSSSWWLQFLCNRSSGKSHFHQENLSIDNSWKTTQMTLLLG